MTGNGHLEDAVLAEVPRALDDLRQLVAVRSVSADPLLAGEVHRSATMVAELLTAEDVKCRVVTTGGSRPAVLGTKPGPPGARTVLLYAHHDVQPVGDGWASDPFTLTERQGRLYGRGSADDKAAIALHLAVLRAFGDALPVNVVLLVEGEEEIGSPCLPALLEAHRDELTADVAVVPDAVNAASGVPALTTALRGIADLVVEVSTLTRTVHSGLYGGALPCALTALVHALGTLHDSHGRIVVEGLEDASLDRVETLADPEGLLLPHVAQIGNGSLAERLVARHAITVLALDAVPVDQAANVLHPRARAKLSIRVPPGRSPEVATAVVEAHLRRNLPSGVRVAATPGALGGGYLAGDGPFRRLAESALGKAFGAPCVSLGVGGSIPFVAALAEALPEAEVLVTAVQDDVSAAHSTDESLSIADFRRASVAQAYLFDQLDGA
jgi:acetylornithine deacetylase/succinyl-diaminopimelate desuccinylase-like protein